MPYIILLAFNYALFNTKVSTFGEGVAFVAIATIVIFLDVIFGSATPTKETSISKEGKRQVSYSPARSDESDLPDGVSLLLLSFLLAVVILIIKIL